MTPGGGGGLLAFAWAATAGVLLLIFLLAFVVALTIAIQAKGDGQAEDFAGCPGRQADDDGDNDPDVSPTDELDLLAGEQGIVMHAGAIEVEARFVAEGVIEDEHDHSRGHEGIDQK